MKSRPGGDNHRMVLEFGWHDHSARAGRIRSASCILFKTECCDETSLKSASPPATQQEQHEQDDQHDAYSPPEPADSSGQPFFRAEFALDELIIVEGVFRQIQTGRVRVFSPAGFLASAALRTGFGVARDVSAAVRAAFRRHVRTRTGWFAMSAS
jgi:hypothetical protein